MNIYKSFLILSILTSFAIKCMNSDNNKTVIAPEEFKQFFVQKCRIKRHETPVSIEFKQSYKKGDTIFECALTYDKQNGGLKYSKNEFEDLENLLQTNPEYFSCTLPPIENDDENNDNDSAILRRLYEFLEQVTKVKKN